MKDLKKYHASIDSIDKKIVALFKQRAANSRKIAGIKNRDDREIYDPARETEVLRNVLAANKGAMDEEGLKAIYNEILSVSRKLQKKLSVAYLGPLASYSNEAAVKRFGSMTQYMPFNSIKDVFDEVEKGNADYGCVPIENSTEGAVNYTFDMFADSDLKIFSEIMLDIRHNLVSMEKDISKLKVIYIHPQTLGQCRRWLETNAPDVPLKEVSSNSRAAQLASQEKGAGAVAGSLAAKVYGLNVLASSIQDMTDNVTRFFIIGNSLSKKTGSDKTSIMVSIKDKVGALYQLLKPFEKYKVNLTNIESRPSKKKAWDYYFFVDFTGHRDDIKVKKALAEIEKYCGAVKILGSYPKF
ncbi:MAG: prephenate dehydratase [Spirochaetia bacterium]|nr:prephenate dehydratase [Spirochaetia bacterium]